MKNDACLKLGQAEEIIMTTRGKKLSVFYENYNVFVCCY